MYKIDLQLNFIWESIIKSIPASELSVLEKAGGLFITSKETSFDTVSIKICGKKRGVNWVLNSYIYIDI